MDRKILKTTERSQKKVSNKKQQLVYATPTGINAYNGDGMVGFNPYGTEKKYQFN